MTHRNHKKVCFLLGVSLLGITSFVSWWAVQPVQVNTTTSHVVRTETVAPNDNGRSNQLGLESFRPLWNCKWRCPLFYSEPELSTPIVSEPPAVIAPPPEPPKLQAELIGIYLDGNVRAAVFRHGEQFCAASVGEPLPMSPETTVTRIEPRLVAIEHHGQDIEMELPVQD